MTIVFLLIFFLPASLARAIDYMPPGVSDTITNLSSDASPASAVGRVYSIVLTVGALTTFGIIVYSALRYILADDSSTRDKARKHIYRALLGLLLFLGAVLALKFINPNLPTLRNSEGFSSFYLS
jgi:hypothetical protein